MASGDTLLVFTALNNEPPSASAATQDTRNSHPVLDFDAALTESAVFGAVMPKAYSGGGLSIWYHFSMSSATSGCVDLTGSFERIGACQQDIDSDGFAAGCKLSDIEVPATSGYVKTASLSYASGVEMDSIVAGEGFRFKVDRNGPTDGAAGDMELRFVEMRET